MSVISITITPSADQTITGIPNTVLISTSEPATVFYTLDGTNPNTTSQVYIDVPIVFPYGKLEVILKVFATNGVDSSAIIEAEYVGNPLSVVNTIGDRLPHAAVTNINNSTMANSLFPFGSSAPNPQFQYLSVADAGTTVYNESLPATSIGFNAYGSPDGYTNKPYSSFQFKQVYDTANWINEVFPGVGNLPAKTTIIGKLSPDDYSPEISSTSDKLFNPRALVIYQDSATEDPTNPVIINRQFFSTENIGVVKDGDLLYSSGIDNPTTTGTYLKSYYNPRTQCLSSYFYDNAVGRWIISTSPYTFSTPNAGNLSHMVFPRTGATSWKVFSWVPFLHRVLI